MNDHLMIYQNTLNLAEHLMENLQYLAQHNSDPAHGQRLGDASIAVMELQDNLRFIMAELDPPTPVCEGCGETAVVKSKYILSFCDSDAQGLWVCAACEAAAEEYANDEWNWPHSDYPPTPAEVR